MRWAALALWSALLAPGGADHRCAPALPPRSAPHQMASSSPAPPLAPAEADYRSAKRKLELIESGRLPPGSYVAFSERELTAYARREASSVAPEGIRSPRVELGPGEATGHAYLDFPKLRRSLGRPLGWLPARLLAGERPVRVKARIRSGGGWARVDPEWVEIGGLAVGGALLDFLVANFLLPYIPEAKVSQSFELAHGIDRLEVRPGEVRVVMGRR